MIFRLVQGILSGLALVFYILALRRSSGSSAAIGYAAFTSIFGIVAAILSLAARWTDRLTVFHILLANGAATVILDTGGVAAAVKGFTCGVIACSLADVMAILLLLACLASAGAAYLAWREHDGEDVVSAPAPTPVAEV
nr:hypothetical protein B0A51_13520 [Rachicladosporium sp. CCFEE 5018]